MEFAGRELGHWSLAYVSAPYENETTAYRVNVIDEDGQVSLTLLLFACDDSEAKRKAKEMADRYGIDLWDGERFIEHFKPTPDPQI